MLSHVGKNPEAAFGVFKVPVLDTGLDDIERGGDDEGGRGTGNRGNEVLEPRGRVVILEGKEVFLGKGRATEELRRNPVVSSHQQVKSPRVQTYSERSRRVTGSSPAPATVKAEALVLDNPEDTTSPEGLGVCLALNLENIEREENDFTDTNQAVGAK